MMRTGTLLNGSRLPLTKWVLAIGLLRVGISARALVRELAVSRQTAWELLHRLRDALRRDVLARKLRGRIEVDETYIDGRQKGKRGRGAAYKSVVIELKVREGRVRSLLMPSVSTAEIHRVLKTHVAKGVRFYTDEFSSYRKVRGIGFRHHRLAHSQRFVRGQTHTQSIEGHWGHVKPTLFARHRAVSPEHLQGYLVEADVKHRLPEDTDFIVLVFQRLLAPQPALPNYLDVALHLKALPVRSTPIGLMGRIIFRSHCLVSIMTAVASNRAALFRISFLALVSARSVEGPMPLP